MDGTSLVNIVRTQWQVEMLKRPGAQHICDSSHPSFPNDLVRAVQDTSATVAFDAVGGGTLASELIYAMEQAAASRLTFHSPFGSFERKHVYIYGHLNTSPTVLTHNNYGFASFPVPCAIADYHAAHAGAPGVPSFDTAYSAVAKRFSA